MVKIPAEEEVKVKWIIGVYYTAFVAAARPLQVRRPS
jgi:hypothetical protein